MSNPSITINVDIPVEQVEDIFTDGLLDIADNFQRTTPVGSTGILKRSWDIDVIKTEGNLTGKIYNTAPNSFHRLLGRGSGRMPPITPLFEWTKAKIEPDEKKAKRIAFLIAKKIGRSGTQRFVKNKNNLGLNKDGSLKPNGKLVQL